MKVFVCNHCHAQVPSETPPESCPLCGQHKRGFFESERPDPSPDDLYYSKLYEDALKTLEDYEEGCPPVPSKFYCEE